MDSSKSSYAVLFLCINLLLCSLARGCYNCNKPGKPIPNPDQNSNPTPVKGTCPRDALKLGICAKLLNGSVGTTIGTPPNHPCCSALGGLLDLEAAVCLCTALKANVLGININIPISLSLLLNTCGKTPPKDFLCA